MKSLLSCSDLGTDELQSLIADAGSYRALLSEAGTVDRVLDGRVVANLFFEPSTRTRLSFELASKRLGAHVLTHLTEASSELKGESLKDTVLTIAAIGVDIFVVRHGTEGMPAQVHEWTGTPVVNGGDGASEHPTQGLLDAVTLTSRFGSVEGLRVGVVGDVGHSRVAGSLSKVLPRLGAELSYIGPEGLLPDSAPDGVVMSSDLDAVLGELDVVYLLRVQRERGALAGDDYQERFGMNSARAVRMRPEAVIMHPGPMNRGVEIEPEVADGARSLILSQVRHGVPTRMAVLAAIGGTL